MQKGNRCVSWYASLMALSIGLHSNAYAEDIDLNHTISEVILDVQAVFEHLDQKREKRRRDFAYGLQSTEDDMDKYFPDRPVSRPIVPIGGGSPYPGFIPSHGATYLLSIEVLYHTLMYFGVEHYFAQSGNSIDFQVISTAEGYFRNLNSATVAFALREFSRYLTAHTCNDPSREAFHKIRSQVPMSEFGLRFKWDMAWALMGNYLPKEPNDIHKIGQKWGAFSQVISSQKVLSGQEGVELKKYAGTITDVINFLTALNKSYCFVDVSIKAREEIIKRVVVKEQLNIERNIIDRYEKYRPVVEAMRKAEEEQRRKQLSSSG